MNLRKNRVNKMIRFGGQRHCCRWQRSMNHPRGILLLSPSIMRKLKKSYLWSPQRRITTAYANEMPLGSSSKRICHGTQNSSHGFDCGARTSLSLLLLEHPVGCGGWLLFNFCLELFSQLLAVFLGRGRFRTTHASSPSYLFILSLFYYLVLL